MKYTIATALIFSVILFSCTNYPYNEKEKEYSGIVINKFRKWNHDVPYIAIRMNNGCDTTIRIGNYGTDILVLFDEIEIGDSVSKKRGNYSINVWHKKKNKVVKYDLWYYKEKFYDGHK